MLYFDEIEDCFPDLGAFCAIDGRATVSAQWLHDFAHAVAAKERDECAKLCDEPLSLDEELRHRSWWECAAAIRERSNVEVRGSRSA